MTATLGEHNLARLAERAFERRGDYESLLFEGRWHGSRELFERSTRLGAGLSELVRPGERVVVTMANSADVGIVYQAVWRAGAVVTPVSFLLPVEDLRHVISNSEAAAVVTTPEFVDKVREATAGLPTLRSVICSDATDAELVSLAALEQAEPSPIVPRADHELAALLYTGGTTGRAKGVMLSHANLDFSGAAGQRAAYVPGIHRALTALPLSHAYGLLVTIAAMHSPERGVGVLMRWFDPAKYLELIAEHRIQTTAVVPSMLQLLLSQALEQHDLSSLRFVTCGGAPLAPEVAQQFMRRVPSASIRQGYGLTESAALISSNPVGREKLGSVGLPVLGTEVRVLDEHGRELPSGEVGEICARSPGVMSGYWRAPETNAEALRDGWLRTGDLGYTDAEGYLYIVDRKKDLIIRGGFNVYPRDVEDALLEHPAIEAAGVVARPDDVHGEEVTAFVSLRPGTEATEAELVEWARTRIGGYKYPREVHVVDAVPLTNVGKVDRKALRALRKAIPAAQR